MKFLHTFTNCSPPHIYSPLNSSTLRHTTTLPEEFKQHLPRSSVVTHLTPLSHTPFTHFTSHQRHSHSPPPVEMRHSPNPASLTLLSLPELRSIPSLTFLASLSSLTSPAHFTHLTQGSPKLPIGLNIHQV
eukprot:GHVN01053207.1.p1 GENE.GHVN01053207.1~~GHVN01053207.1.p1  ORF type:complete len:131 (-),score=42.42 GHVN01053207.1:31-423(-)